MPRQRKGQPISVAPGQEYGARKQQEEAQRVAPLAGAGDVLGAAEAFQPKNTQLTAPGDPEQPITSGLSRGPGPGPEVVTPPNIPQSAGVDALLAAPLLSTLGALAATRRLSPGTVRFMRLLRAELPVGYDPRQLLSEDDRGTR